MCACVPNPITDQAVHSKEAKKEERGVKKNRVNCAS